MADVNLILLGRVSLLRILLSVISGHPKGRSVVPGSSCLPESSPRLSAPARPCGRGRLAQFSLLQRFAVWWVALPWPILPVPAVLLALCRVVAKKESKSRFERNRFAVGKTANSLVSPRPQQLTPLPCGGPARPLPGTKAIRRANFRLGHRAPGRGGRRAWTISGCLNSAFLNISQHFTVHLFRPWILSSEGRGRKLSWRANALDLTLPRVLFVADSNRTSEVLRSFFKVIARPADGNERIEDLDVQGGWYGEFA